MKNKKKKHIDNPLSAIKNNILPPNSLTVDILRMLMLIQVVNVNQKEERHKIGACSAPKKKKNKRCNSFTHFIFFFLAK